LYIDNIPERALCEVGNSNPKYMGVIGTGDPLMFLCVFEVRWN